MEEETTTPEVTPETGAEEALPVAADQPEAESPAVDEPSAASEGGEEKPVPEVDDKLQSFAKGQGIDDISELSDREMKLLKVARDNQAEYQRNRQKASELEKAATVASDSYAETEAAKTGQDPEVLRRLQSMEIKGVVREFYDNNPEARQYDALMGEIATERPYLAGDLEALYATAVVKSGGVAAVKSQGKREALESLAHKQQAAVPTGNATTSGTPKAKPFAELSIAEMEKRLGSIQR